MIRGSEFISDEGWESEVSSLVSTRSDGFDREITDCAAARRYLDLGFLDRRYR